MKKNKQGKNQYKTYSLKRKREPGNAMPDPIRPMLSGINKECPQVRTLPAKPEACERKGLRSYFFLNSYNQEKHAQI